MAITVIKDLGLIRAERCGTCYHNIFDMNMQKDYEKEKKNAAPFRTHTTTLDKGMTKRGKREIFFFIPCL